MERESDTINVGCEQAQARAHAIGILRYIFSGPHGQCCHRHGDGDVRAVNGLPEIYPNLWPVALFLLIAGAIALNRCRGALD